jgi:Asp-tRNA(Asn)/Glu-tRNA(Gln) amidotransferase A subunit family amidase
MDAVVTQSATWMARAVRDGAIGAVELLDAHAARIADRNPSVNAIVNLRLDAARAEAQAADSARARSASDLGPLHGVPFTVKEIVAVAGMPWTNGSRIYADRVAAADAELVRRMRRAGAILLGTTNLSEFCAFWDSVNRVYGATANPHDPARSAGGSSGGEAAALAAAMTPLGIGTDLTGSIRAPAHWTGVYGLRTSRDALPHVDHDPLPSTAGIQMFGVAGPMARTPGDLGLLLSVLAEPRVSARAPARVAVFEEDGLQPVSRACRAAVQRAAGALDDLGVDVVEARPPHQAELRAAFDTILVHELVPALGRAVAGHAAELMPYNADQAEAARAFTPSFDAYAAAFAQIAAIDAAAMRWFDEHPVALCPVTPDVAPPLGTFAFPPVDGTPPRPGGKLSLCAYASALGLPALSLPVMRSPDGLPVGVQLIARRGQERTLVALAERLEAVLGGWLAPDA